MNARARLWRVAAGLLSLAIGGSAARAGETQYYFDPLGRLLGAFQSVGGYRASLIDKADNPSYLKVYPTVPPVAQDTMYPDNVLFANQSMYSAGACFQLILQNDGNLVLYKGTPGSPGSTALWSTQTSGNLPGYFTLASNGDLLLLGPDNSILWHTNTTTYPNAHLSVQTDGTLVLYQGSNYYWRSSNSGTSC